MQALVVRLAHCNHFRQILCMYSVTTSPPSAAMFCSRHKSAIRHSERDSLFSSLPSPHTSHSQPRQLTFVSKKRARQLANPTYQANTPKLKTYQPTTHQHVNLSSKTPKLANPTYQPSPKITHRATISSTAHNSPTDAIH